MPVKQIIEFDPTTSSTSSDYLLVQNEAITATARISYTVLTNNIASDISGSFNILTSEDFKLKTIPIAGALSPATSGADLNVFQTADGMYSDSLDFANGDSAYINFILPDNYLSGQDIQVQLKMTAANTGTAGFSVKIGVKQDGTIYTASTGAVAVSDTQNISATNEIFNKVINIPYANHNATPNALAIIGISRDTSDTLTGDLKILGCQIKWQG
jgi:hypothetical protein